jgi:hypothetical protein
MVEWLPSTSRPDYVFLLNGRPQSGSFVAAIAMYEEVTLISSFWYEFIEQLVKSAGYETTSLKANEDSQASFEIAMLDKNPKFVYGSGHGRETYFLGQGGYFRLEKQEWVEERVLEAGDKNLALLKNRIVYLLACLTAKELGSSIIQAGAETYLGYGVPYGFIEISWVPSIFPPSYGRYHWTFMDQNNCLVNSILSGGTTSDSVAFSIERANAWIDWWSMIDDPVAPDMISFLQNDIAGLKVLGNSSAYVSPPSPPKHVRAVYAIGMSGLAVTSGSSVTLNIASTCQQSDCDFRGRKLTVKGRLGEFEGPVGDIIVNIETSFQYYYKGINYTTITFTAPTVEKTQCLYLDLTVEADEIHEETLGKAVVVIFPA